MKNETNVIKSKLFISDVFTNIKQFSATGEKHEQLKKEGFVNGGVIRGVVSSISTGIDKFDNEQFTVKGDIQMMTDDNRLLTASKIIAGDKAFGVLVEKMSEVPKGNKLKFQLAVRLIPNDKSKVGYAFDYGLSLDIENKNLFADDNFLALTEKAETKKSK